MRQWERGTRAAVTQRARVKCVIDKPSDARLRSQASVTEQDIRKSFICDLPVTRPYHNRWRKQNGKGAEFYKISIFKKGVDKFSKNYVSGISFRVVCFVCFEPSDPSERTVPRSLDKAERPPAQLRPLGSCGNHVCNLYSKVPSILLKMDHSHLLSFYNCTATIFPGDQECPLPRTQPGDQECPSREHN